MKVSKEFRKAIFLYFKILGFIPCKNSTKNRIRKVYFIITSTLLTIIHPFLSIIQLFLIRDTNKFIHTINMSIPLIVCGFKRLCFIGKFQTILKIHKTLDSIQGELEPFQLSQWEINNMKRIAIKFLRLTMVLGMSTLTGLCIIPFVQSERVLIFECWYPSWLNWKENQNIYRLVIVYQIFGTLFCGGVDMITEPVFAAYLLVYSGYMKSLKHLVIPLESTNKKQSIMDRKENFKNLILLIKLYKQLDE